MICVSLQTEKGYVLEDSCGYPVFCHIHSNLCRYVPPSLFTKRCKEHECIPGRINLFYQRVKLLLLILVLTFASIYLTSTRKYVVYLFCRVRFKNVQII